MTPRPGPVSPERATLSRDLADFLIELSIALHKHAMYPADHPSLGPAASAVTRRAALLLEDRATLSLGVARRQLVIEGVATDAKPPVLGELAGRRHRHLLGAVTFRRGVEAHEVSDALRTLAVDPERSGQPLGLGDPARRGAWPHVQLHALTYERLELSEGADQPAGSGARASQLWVGLARAALATAPADAQPLPTEPAVIDVYDALRTNRPYREAWPHGKTLADLRDRAGIELDADLVGAFVRMMAQWEPQVTVVTDEHTPVIAAVQPAAGI